MTQTTATGTVTASSNVDGEDLARIFASNHSQIVRADAAAKSQELNAQGDAAIKQAYANQINKGNIMPVYGLGNASFNSQYMCRGGVCLQPPAPQGAQAPAVPVQPAAPAATPAPAAQPSPAAPASSNTDAPSKEEFEKLKREAAETRAAAQLVLGHLKAEREAAEAQAKAEEPAKDAAPKTEEPAAK
jgi:hypothetical protein